MKPLKKLALLAIDDLTAYDAIRNQIHEIKELGFDGLVFQTRNYCGSPEYLSEKYMKAVSDIIIYAKSLEMDFWIGDEQSERACSANDAFEKELTATQSCWLELSSDKSYTEKRFKAGINMLDFSCVRELIEQTYEKYKSGLPKEAFNYVNGFFSDKNGFVRGNGCGRALGGVPWYDDIVKDYNQKYGEDINSRLIELFAPEGQSKEIKAQYWQLITERLKVCYFDQIQEWCNQNNKLFMAELKGDKTPFLQVSYHGSAVQALKDVNIPGVSGFGRYAGNCYYPRIASSAARQFGDGTCMCKALYGAGWGLNPYDLEKNISWLIECGINTFVFHCARPDLKFDNIIDRPASFPTHMPWKSALPSIFEKLDHLAEIEFDRPRNILVITPMQAIWENYVPDKLGEISETDGSNQPVCLSSELSDKALEICNRLHEIGRRFDITDEITFENNVDYRERGVTVGSAAYSTILVTPGCSFSKKGMMYIERAKANGVRILTDIPTTDTEVIPLELIKSRTQEIVPMKIHQSDWSVTFPKQNRLVLIPKQDGENLICNFTADSDFSAGPVKLLVSDETANVSINNIIVTAENRDEYGIYYDITDNILGGKNTILLENCGHIYACLLGDFKVISSRGYLIFDERQVQTSYDFILKNPTMESNSSLTECGYPFCTDYVIAKKIFITRENILHPYIQIDCRNVSAMEVKFDGAPVGYVYGKNNTLEVPSIESGQQHLVEVKAFSSAFNAYGPHFYYKGDSGLVTPSQYFGVKDFTDDANAPDVTTNNRMKLVLWSLPKNIDIIQKF